MSEPRSQFLAHRRLNLGQRKLENDLAQEVDLAKRILSCPDCPYMNRTTWIKESHSSKGKLDPREPEED